jgi:hypothetical protein
MIKYPMATTFTFITQPTTNVIVAAKIERCFIKELEKNGPSHFQYQRHYFRESHYFSGVVRGAAPDDPFFGDIINADIGVRIVWITNEYSPDKNNGHGLVDLNP